MTPKRDKEARFCVGQLVYMNPSQLSTSFVDRMAVEACSKLLLRVLGPYHVTSTTLHTITIDQVRVDKTTSADWASLATTLMQPLDDLVLDEYH